MNLSRVVSLAAVVLLSASASADEAAWPNVAKVEKQPLLAQVNRLQQALDYVGSPLSPETLKQLEALKGEEDAARVAAAVQKLLDPLCVAAIEIGKDGKTSVVPAPGKPELVEQGWRTFLVKVCNHAEATSTLRVESPNAQPVPHSPAAEVDSRWLDLSSFSGRPLTGNLGGLELEYRIVQLFSRDAGEKKASLVFSVGTKKPLLREWRFDGDAAGWKALNQCEVSAEKGILRVKSSGNDPYLGADVEGPKGKLVLRFWAKFDRPGQGQVFWRTKERTMWGGGHMANFPIRAGQEAEYTVPFESDGTLAGIRLDTGNAPGETQIHWITLANADEGKKDAARTDIGFVAKPSTRVTFRVTDGDGNPAMACFEVRDAAGRVYPAPSKRVAPDFFFHPQIYRETGESVRLPEGKYTFRCSRGPEAVPETKTLEVGKDPVTFQYEVKRWIDPLKYSYYSGDHHIHAAGCQHYENPTQGVHPPDMMRHILGEDLKIGCCLTWGPCFDYQKRFFSGKPDAVSKPPYLLRYDVEVSGFGSHQSGHLCLLRLKEQIPPGGDSKTHWPTLGLNTLRWAKKQGAVCGPAHSASGLTRYIGKLEGREGANRLPNFMLPAYDGIGANEFVVDVPHEVPGPDGKPVPAIDFISTMNTDRVAEWNMWYHVLNCGFRVKASGETDFPCVSGQRVGMGRVYVKVDGKLDYERWCQGIADGRCYVSDGTTHLIDFTARPAAEGGKAVEVGTNGSEVKLKEASKVEFTVKAAVRRPAGGKVAVELVVNGYPVAKEEIEADGKLRDLKFEAKIDRSSWATVRVFPSGHSNPIFVMVDDKPIRASKASANWCLEGVEQCWKSKKGTYAAKEMKEAEEAYEHARKVYKRIRDESPDEK